MCVPDRSDRRLDTVGIRGPERARMPTFSLDVVLTVGNRGPERARMLTFPPDVVLTVGNRGPERALSPTFGWNSRIVFATVQNLSRPCA